MQFFSTLLALAAIASSALAASNVPSETNCGGRGYSSDDIAIAINTAVRDAQSGNYPDMCWTGSTLHSFTWLTASHGFH
ncbi:unnamed protein product, partial [Tilletia caries]